MSYQYTLQSLTPKEKRRAKRFLIWGLCLVCILGITLIVIDTSYEIWYPQTALEFTTNFIFVLFFAAIGITVLFGIVPFIQHLMARGNSPGSVSSPTAAPADGVVGAIGIGFLIASIVYLVRTIILIFS